ncbi:MAG: hypothetical protein L0922_05115 [Candidatus Mariimomonas ferrooxydans]
MPYRIAHWQTKIEVAKSKTINFLDWIPIPNKLNNPDYIELVEDHPDGPIHFAIFITLVQLVSLQHKDVRDGWLTRNGKADGPELTPLQLSRQIRIKVEYVEEAMKRLTAPDMAWIVGELSRSQHPTGTEQVPGDPPTLQESTLHGIKEHIKIPKAFPVEYLNLSEAFYEHRVSLFPHLYPQGIDHNTTVAGAKTIDSLIRLDGYTLEQVKSVLRFALTEDFWQTNARSITRLRVTKRDNKFQELLAQVSGRAQSGNSFASLNVEEPSP